MPEFDLDHLKKSWQQQPAQPKYDSTEIELMLNKTSRNYVKYILWISILEFILICGANLYYTFLGENTTNLMSVLHKLGIEESPIFKNSVAQLYLILKLISLLLTGAFVILFYRNYRKIDVECNLKNLITQIIRFRKTVQLFIVANIVLVILFILVLSAYTFAVMAVQNVHLTNNSRVAFLFGIFLIMAICVLLIWIYYRLVYGFILGKLGKNLQQLQNIEKGN